MQAVILAGGLGTRVRNITKDRIPKVMLPINGKPFLEYVLIYLKSQNMKNVILCVGFKKEIIEDYFKDGSGYGMNIIYSEEDIPLGTGGALKKAKDLITGNNFLLLNGDTLFKVNLEKLVDFHIKKNSLVTIALKYVDNTYRFGRIETEPEGKIIKFAEKGFYGEGSINGGVYVVKKKVIERIKRLPCSWERDILPSLIGQGVYGLTFDEYFIDIGIPEDYEKAGEEIENID